MTDSTSEIRASWAQAFLDTMRPEAKEEIGDFAHGLLRVAAGRRQERDTPDDRGAGEIVTDAEDQAS